MTTEARIQAALLNLMERFDYTDITVTQVAKEAGVDRRTFYRHYAGIAEVLAGFEHDIIKTIKHTLGEQPFSTTRFIAGMNENIKQYYSFFDDMAVTQKHAFFFNHSVDNITHILQASLQPGAGMSEVEFQMRLRFVAAGIVRVYLDWMHDGEPVSLAEMTAGLDAIVAPALAEMVPKTI